MRFQKFVLPSTLVMLAASSVLVGCATPSSAPIVHRTTGTETSEAKREYYTVGRGDTLSGIGQRFGVSTRDIVEWNQLSANPVLQAGQVLRVAAPVVAAAPKPAAPTDVAQTAPIRPPVAVVSPVDSPKVAVKTGPKGIKRPYSDDTYAQMAKGETSATGVAAASPSVVVIPAPATVTPTAAATTVPPATDTRADASGLSWSWPAAGKVMQTFDRKTNKGFTISGEPGKPVIAAAKGKVIFAKDFPDYGKLVIVSHGPDLVSIYGYNNSISVKEGQQVERGQKVGEQGPRVQFEVRRSGQPIDPSQFLPQR